MKKIFLFAIGALLSVLLAAVAFIIVRQAWAAAKAERKWQSTQVEAPKDFGSISGVEVLPLYEEAGDQSIYQIYHPARNTR